MSIRFRCTNCGKELKAAVEHAGVRVKCPACGTIQAVPQDVFEAEAVPAPAPEAPAYGLAPTPQPSQSDDRKPCPACGEMIKRSALKCRFCGEVFDESLAREERRRRGGADSDLTAGDWVLAVLCSGIGCIVGIVYLAQGKPKGGKMLGISIGFIIFWNIIRFMIMIGLEGMPR
jgi:predicted RNA-binding Zn-ribbon protein involved in translation (DUF1610 family)